MRRRRIPPPLAKCTTVGLWAERVAGAGIDDGPLPKQGPADPPYVGSQGASGAAVMGVSYG